MNRCWRSRSSRTRAEDTPILIPSLTSTSCLGYWCVDDVFGSDSSNTQRWIRLLPVHSNAVVDNIRSSRILWPQWGQDERCKLKKKTTNGDKEHVLLFNVAFVHDRNQHFFPSLTTVSLSLLSNHFTWDIFLLHVLQKVLCSFSVRVELKKATTLTNFHTALWFSQTACCVSTVDYESEINRCLGVVSWCFVFSICHWLITDWVTMTRWVTACTYLSR